VKTPRQSGIKKKRRNETNNWFIGIFSRLLGTAIGRSAGVIQRRKSIRKALTSWCRKGNAFEAGVVSGVEDSRKRNGKEVRIRGVPKTTCFEYLDEE
jgi:hypothetical protein